MMAPAVVPAPGGPSALRDRHDRSVVTVAAIAVIVLLIACLNLANLFLARGEARRAVLIGVAIAATLWPARRAARLNPAVLLRDC